MMNARTLFASTVGLALFFGATAAPMKLPDKKDFHVYLLMGQSTMAGMGRVEPEDTRQDPRVLMLGQVGGWQHAAEPVTVDSGKDHGVGPAFAFGKAMAEKNPGVTIGLIPCAVSSTPLQRWSKGEDLYLTALRRARRAMKDGTFCGILWHQGERDSSHENTATNYGERLAIMIQDLRKDIGVTNAPFVVGQLGDFFKGENGLGQFATMINQALADLPNKVLYTGCASAKGLTDIGDNMHFNSASQRELGRRYADIMVKLEAASVYPRTNMSATYLVDPKWPQPPADIPWAGVAGVAISPDTNIWIYTRTNPVVQLYNTSGGYLKGWTEADTNTIPESIRFDHDGNVWLVDCGLHTVTKYTQEQKKLLTLGVAGVPGDDATHFNKPTDVAIAPNGDIFVTDGYANNRVVHFDKTGKFLYAWGGLGFRPGEFSLPHAIVCDSKSRLYVADRNNTRIQVFDTEGKMLDTWSNVITPWGLWISPKDEIWACGSSPMPWGFDGKYPNAPLGCPPKDQLFMKFNTEGKLLQLWTAPKGEDGHEKPGDLNWLHSMALDPDGNIYCGDLIGQRVQKFLLQK